MADLFSNVGVVVAAGGSSRRFAGRRCKLLEPLDGMPLVCHCVKTLLGAVTPAHMVVVVPAALRAEFATALRAQGVPDEVKLVEGGAERQDSVWRGLGALPPDVGIVAIQDAARPFTTVELLQACVESARRRGSGIAAVRVTDTIKVARDDGEVITTPDRTTLWAAETPQVFRRELITRAYEEVIAAGRTVTDDAQAVELLGQPTYLVCHASVNRKITYPADLD